MKLQEQISRIQEMMKLNESGDEIVLIDPTEEMSELGKEFGVSLNTNIFLGSDETYYEIYKGEEKIGFLVISTDRYEHYNFDELLNGKVIYLNFIRLHEKGFLRQVISKLKDKVKDNYDYIVLEISGQSYDQFKELETKYKNIGFKGILPDDISEYNLGLPEGIDPYEDNVFMYTEV